MIEQERISGENNSFMIHLHHQDKRDKTQNIPLKDKLEMLKINIEETQKYELLTTNQYLKHIELVVSILEDLTKNTYHYQEL